MRSRLLALCCLLLLGCAGGETAQSASTETTEPDTTSTTPPVESPTSSPTTTTTTTTSSPPTLVERLDDGRPATFLAVTREYEAVEVSTETGAVIRSFGSRATAADIESAQEMAPNAIDAVWRTSDGRHILISECCEPAAGRINVLPPDGTVSPDYDDPATEGWAALPSPVDSKVVLVGYVTSVVAPQTGIDPDDCESVVRGACWTGVSFLENDGSGIGSIGWNHDGVRVHWYDPGSANLLTWDSDTGELFRAPLTWVSDNQSLVGLTGQASGNVVSFLHSHGPDLAIMQTEGVVYSPDSGGVIATFDVPAGSVLGGYDPGGVYLIYTTTTGTVEFQGRGRTGTLGSGYFFASW